MGGRDDFQADPRIFRCSLFDNNFIELAITGEHATTMLDLPMIHRDPFDRMLVAQARAKA